MLIVNIIQNWSLLYKLNEEKKSVICKGM